MSSGYRKIELQSPADFTYLYTNTVSLSRQKLDLHLPPSANPTDEPDPMRERVKELVDEFINQTFTTASPSISINGLDLDPSLATATQPAESIEYEPYDTELAGRVTALYAQLEALTTTVAQMRRDAPVRAARVYAETLDRIIQDDDDGEEDVVMHGDEDRWMLDVPLGSRGEAERWRDGDMAGVYEATLRTLLRLQGEDGAGPGAGAGAVGGPDGNALASTLGKAERAGRAVEVVERM